MLISLKYLANKRLVSCNVQEGAQPHHPSQSLRRLRHHNAEVGVGVGLKKKGATFQCKFLKIGNYVQEKKNYMQARFDIYFFIGIKS